LNSKAVSGISIPAMTPELRVESTSGSAGSSVTLNIRVDALGNESQYGFAVLFDPSVLTYRNFTTGETQAGTFSCNATLTAGRIRCDAGNFVNNQTGTDTRIKEIAQEDNQILIKVIFTVAAGATANTTTPVSLASASASDESANSIVPMTSGGTVTINALAASVSVTGKVVTQTGRGIRNVVITMTDSQGSTRMATTSSFGYYRFDDVRAGETYILTATGKRFLFDQPSQILNVNHGTTDINFIGY
jgi:hypothetical protein